MQIKLTDDLKNLFNVTLAEALDTYQEILLTSDLEDEDIERARSEAHLTFARKICTSNFFTS